MPLIRCGICTSERREVVNAMLASGRTPYAIEREMRKVGSPTKSETVARHRDNCLNGDPSRGDISTEGLSNRDFAVLVQREAVRLLQAGELRVKTGDGLQAQALLDRRAEQSANRTLVVNLARLLSGAPPPEVLDTDSDPDLIRGEFRQLAPPALIAEA